MRIAVPGSTSGKSGGADRRLLGRKASKPSLFHVTPNGQLLTQLRTFIAVSNNLETAIRNSLLSHSAHYGTAREKSLADNCPSRFSGQTELDIVG